MSYDFRRRYEAERAMRQEEKKREMKKDSDVDARANGSALFFGYVCQVPLRQEESVVMRRNDWNRGDAPATMDEASGSGRLVASET